MRITDIYIKGNNKLFLTLSSNKSYTVPEMELSLPPLIHYHSAKFNLHHKRKFPRFLGPGVRTLLLEDSCLGNADQNVNSSIFEDSFDHAPPPITSPPSPRPSFELAWFLILKPLSQSGQTLYDGLIKRLIPKQYLHGQIQQVPTTVNWVKNPTRAGCWDSNTFIHPYFFPGNSY